MTDTTATVTASDSGQLADKYPILTSLLSDPPKQQFAKSDTLASTATVPTTPTSVVQSAVHPSRTISPANKTSDNYTTVYLTGITNFQTSSCQPSTSTGHLSNSGLRPPLRCSCGAVITFSFGQTSIKCGNCKCYWCLANNCDTTFIKYTDFERHVNKRHPGLKHGCRRCGQPKTQSQSTDDPQIVQCLFCSNYWCSLCLFESDTTNKMLQHSRQKHV